MLEVGTETPVGGSNFTRKSGGDVHDQSAAPFADVETIYEIDERDRIVAVGCGDTEVT